jgi:hypothetical protein
MVFEWLEIIMDKMLILDFNTFQCCSFLESVSGCTQEKQHTINFGDFLINNYN